MNKNRSHTSYCKTNRMFNRGLAELYGEGTYKSGKRNGKFVTREKNGLKTCEYNYKDGLPNGEILLVV